MSYTGKEIYDKEEVYHHKSGIDLQISQAPSSTFRCSNCEKKKIHSYVGSDGPVVRCSHKDCECKCKTHYACKQGRLHPYGSDCTCTDTDELVLGRSATVEALNAEWRESRKKQETQLQRTKELWEGEE